MEKLLISRRLGNILWNNNIDCKISIKDANDDRETFRAEVCISSRKLFFDSVNKDKDWKIQLKPPVWGNYFDVVRNKLTYHAGKQPTTENGLWKREGRQEMKPAKFVRFMVNYFEVSMSPSYDGEVRKKLTDRFVEILSSRIVLKEIPISVSDDPETIYELETSTSQSVGTLGNSCMRSEASYDCANFSGFYTELGLKIAYVNDEMGRLVARALLWHDVVGREDDMDGKTFNFMDRIYGTDENVERFKLWAHKNGYAHKAEQSYDNNRLILPPDENDVSNEIREYDKKFIGDYDFRGAPYIDTMCHLTINSNGITLSSYDGDYSLTSCDAHYPGNTRCENCGQSIGEDDFCAEINGDNYCEDCAVWSEREYRYLLDSDARWSEEYSSYISDCDAIYVNGDYYYEDDEDLVVIRGFYYHIDSDDVTHCEECGDYHLSDDVHYYEEVSLSLCEDCVEEVMEREGYVIEDGEWVREGERELESN